MARSKEDIIFSLSMAAQDFAVMAVEYKQANNRKLALDCIRLYNMTTALVSSILEDRGEEV